MRRIAFYRFRDEDGIVDDYVVHCVGKLKDSVERVVVVSNGGMDDRGRAALEAVADDVWEFDPAPGGIGQCDDSSETWQSEVPRFDPWTHRAGLDRFGWDRLVEYDELILTDDSFYGPLRSFDGVLAASEEWDVDFWGLFEHDDVVFTPVSNPPAGVSRHLDACWLAVRQPMLSSRDFLDYWADLPGPDEDAGPSQSQADRFTLHFASLGYDWRALFEVDDYPGANPVLHDALRMVRDGSPVLPRRLFFQSPFFSSQSAVMARDLMETVRHACDYPLRLVWANVARTVEPRVAATNLSHMRIFSDALEIDGPQLDAVERLSIAVTIHCFYPEMIDELLVEAFKLPGRLHLVVTTDTGAKRDFLEGSIAEFLRVEARPGVSFEVRVVGSNAGRDVSAFVIGCADVLRSDYDFVVKLHSKRSPQVPPPAAEAFKRQLLESLLHSPNYARNVLSLLVEHPEIGMAIPPLIHIGFPTLGNAWFLNKEPAQRFLARIGVGVRFDETTPLSTYGSMFVTRPRAMRPIVDAGLTWEDFEGDYFDGSLAHVIERIFTYSCLGQGLLVYQVANTRLAEVNYMYLEYELQDFCAGIPGTTLEKRRRLRALVERDPAGDESGPTEGEGSTDNEGGDVEEPEPSREEVAGPDAADSPAEGAPRRPRDLGRRRWRGLRRVPGTALRPWARGRSHDGNPSDPPAARSA